jgi:LmbE family N-acetylglucosaminyl deacetylase
MPTVVATESKDPPHQLMIVAHPDDELLFGGDELLAGAGWKVVCVTGGSRRAMWCIDRLRGLDRQTEFRESAKALGFAAEMWDFQDHPFNSRWNRSLLCDMLGRLLDEYSWSRVVTHAADGEYGHRQHRLLSQLVRELSARKRIKPEVFQLDRDRRCSERKRELLHRLYPSQQYVFKIRSEWAEHCRVV